MGIYNRDYYRQYGSGDQLPSVCRNLIIANVIVFLLQIFITRPSTPQDLQALIEQNKRQAPERKIEKKPTESSKSSGTKATADDKERPPEEDVQEDNELASELLPSVSIVQEWFELDTNKVVRQGQVWRMLTCAFCHDRFVVWHILMNMLFLYLFGKMLEPLYGPREFLLFYLAAAVVASACYIGLDLFTHRSVPAIGASGAVMAVVVLYAIHHPREKIYVFMMFPIEIRWLVAIYVMLDLHPVLLALSGTPQYTGIANAAHLGGAAFGFLYWRFNLRLVDTWDRVSRLRRRWRVSLQRNVRLYQESDDSGRNDLAHDDLDALVDKILEKIHKQGESSLTDHERKVLKKAADRYLGRSKA